jgi:hypothetical protein
MRIREAFLILVIANSCYAFHISHFPSHAAARFMTLRSNYQSDQHFSKSQSRAKLVGRIRMTTTSREQAMEECKHMSIRDIKVYFN